MTPSGLCEKKNYHAFALFGISFNQILIIEMSFIMKIQFVHWKIPAEDRQLGARLIDVSKLLLKMHFSAIKEPEFN